MQCPSFLAHQRRICERIGHGRSNCRTLLGIKHSSSDNPIRLLLDDVEPSNLYGLFDEALAAIERAGALPSLTSLSGHTKIALVGRNISARISCRAGIARPANTPMGRSIIFILSWPPASSNPARPGFCLYDRNWPSLGKVTTSKTAKAEPPAAGSR